MVIVNKHLLIPIYNSPEGMNKYNSVYAIDIRKWRPVVLFPCGYFGADDDNFTHCFGPFATTCCTKLHVSTQLTICHYRPEIEITACQHVVIFNFREFQYCTLIGSVFISTSEVRTAAILFSIAGDKSIWVLYGLLYV